MNKTKEDENLFLTKIKTKEDFVKMKNMIRRKLNKIQDNQGRYL